MHDGIGHMVPPLGRHPPGRHPPRQTCPFDGQCAGGTHPTGIHSRSFEFSNLYHAPSAFLFITFIALKNKVTKLKHII